MTVLPGKRGPSVLYPGRVYRSDLDRDLRSLREAGVTQLILLVTDAELERWSDPDIGRRATAVGITLDRYPMPDGSAPEAGTMDAILVALATGRGAADVAVACMGGVGRTGTVVVCALVSAGWDVEAAIAHVRRIRHPQAVETPAQVSFVRAWRASS